MLIRSVVVVFFTVLVVFTLSLVLLDFIFSAPVLFRAKEERGCALETLRPDNGDVHENVAEKFTSHPFTFFAIIPKGSVT